MRAARRRWGRSVFAALALASTSCRESLAPAVDEPAGLVIVSGDEQTSRAGERLTAPLVVRVVNARFRPVAGAVVDFTVVAGGGTVSRETVLSRNNGTAETTWTLGKRTADPQRVQARLAGGAGAAAATAITFNATAAAGPPESVVVLAGNGQRRPPGVTLRDSLAVQVRDAFGNPVPGVGVVWRVTAGGGVITPALSVTDSAGTARASWTLGPSSGAQRTEAALAGQDLLAVFAAETVPNPTISRISPDPAVAGATATIQGSHFGPLAAEVRVMFNGSTAPVEYADSTEIRVRVPCEPSGPVKLTLHANGTTTQATHAMVVPDPLTLAIGEATPIGPATLCREVTGAGRYLLAVVNATTGAGTSGFRLRGGTTFDPPPPTTAAAAAARRNGPQRAYTTLRQTRRQAHDRVLLENQRLVEHLGPRSPAPAGHANASTALAPTPAAIVVNDTVSVKIPDAAGNLCTIRAQIRARVVFIGARSIVMEDVAAPLAQTMDSSYRALAEELERVHWGIIEANFGNPLAYDAQTDGDGRVRLVFSGAINELRTVAAFTSSGDLYPAAACAASNTGEVLYGPVPTDSRRGYGDGSIDNVDNWLHTMRAVMIHELKHMTAFAEKFARNGATTPRLEDAWLEEATAVIAEELFGRAIYGYRRQGNTTYSESLLCEIRPDPGTDPSDCWHKPLVMYSYFALLYDYLAGTESLTPFGATGPDDATFYGSSWSLLRWAVDQFATSESSFLRALVQERTLRGASNLEARTGRSLADLLVDWTLASAIDDRADVSDSQPIHSHPSWNTRDIHAAMHHDSPGQIPSPFPLPRHVLSGGSFSIAVDGVRPGGAALFEFTVSPAVPQLINLVAPGPTDEGEAGLALKVLRIR